MERPLILVTNDDGIESPWLALIAEELASLGDVMVSAPASEQSAVGQSITLSDILRVRSRRPGWYAVAGTPTDAVLLALLEFCPRPPDLVVSGINPGPNLGTDVFYSGTVAGAFQAAMRDVQAMAVSQEVPSGAGPEVLEPLFHNTAEFARFVAAKLLCRPLPPRTILNINAPATPARGFAWTRMGRRVYRENVERRLDPKGVPYFWIGGPPLHDMNPPGTDSHAVERGLFSVTPLVLDLTADIGTWYDGLHPQGHPWEDCTREARSDGPARG